MKKLEGETHEILYRFGTHEHDIHPPLFHHRKMNQTSLHRLF